MKLPVLDGIDLNEPKNRHNFYFPDSADAVVAQVFLENYCPMWNTWATWFPSEYDVINKLIHGLT